MYITGFFHVIGSLAKKTRKFHHIFFYYSIFFLHFLSLVSLKQSPAATAAMQWPEDATRVSEASKAWADTTTTAAAAGGGGTRHASTAGMKWRRNDDDERNLLIEYDSLAFQAENGKFSAHHDYYRMNWRGVPPPSPQSPHQCEVQRRRRRGGVAGSQWNPRSILSIEVHHTSSIKTRWLKLEFGNESQSTAHAAIVYTYACSVGGGGTPRRSCRYRRCRVRRTGWYSWKEGQEHTTEWISFRLTFKKVVCQFPMIENDFFFSHNTNFVKAKLVTQRGFQHWVSEDSNFAHWIILLQTSLCML